MFHNTFELSAAVVHHTKTNPRIITDVQFCQTNQAQKIFKDISFENGSSPLETVLKFLEFKLSRTDSALNLHKASRMDYFPDASKSGT